MYTSSAPTGGHALPPGIQIRVFGAALHIIWFAVVALTILSEVIPFPGVAPVYFYSYVAIKLVLFFTVGYLTPLAFWRFNSVSTGFLLCLLSASAVEGFQAVSHGHRFSWLELIVKFFLIFLGFTLALETRYERQIRLGPLRILLTGKHLPSPE